MVSVRLSAWILWLRSFCGWMCFSTLFPLASQAAFVCTTNDGAVTIKRYYGFDAVVLIPQTINGLPVVNIGSNAFSSVRGLKRVILPTSITNIDSYAFAHSSSLTNVELAPFVRGIGALAFYDCPALTTIAIPDSVLNLGPYAFQDCIHLCVATFGAGLTNIGTGTFSNCGELKEIVVDAGNQTYSSMSGVLFTKDRSRLIKYPPGRIGTFLMPNDVTLIDGGAFTACKNLRDITIPSGIRTVEKDTFRECTNLVSVTFTNGVTNFGMCAFLGCERLLSLALPDSVRWIGDYAFNGCGLRSLTLGAALESVGNWAFAGCVELATTVTVPSGATNIGEYAFASCFRVPGFYFKGNAPVAQREAFQDDSSTIIYYMPHTVGWTSTFSGRPTRLWNPSIGNFALRSNTLGFTITGTTNIPVVVQASSTLTNINWGTFGNYVLNGPVYFSQTCSTNVRTRFYRLCWP